MLTQNDKYVDLEMGGMVWGKKGSEKESPTSDWP